MVPECRWHLLQRFPNDSRNSSKSRRVAGAAADVGSAKALLATGFATLPAEIDPAEVAAWTHVARVLFNLHETITRN